MSSSPAPAVRLGDPLYVGSLEKGMRVLEAFRGQAASLSLTELADRTGLGKSATQRFTHTWTTLGYLTKDARTRHYRLTPRLLELGYFFLRQDSLTSLAAPHLVALRDRCGLSVNLSVLADDGSGDMLYLLRLPSPELTLDEILPGRRMPAWSNSAGRMLLSACDPTWLETVLARTPPQAYNAHTEIDPALLRESIRAAAEDGYAITENQVLQGQIGAAVLLPRIAGAPLASISVRANTDSQTADTMRQDVVPLLLRTAYAISGG